ncbi:MAG: hypothetical protein NT066_06785 [Candidatus Omnitrophica bacterium]|nr:hypothetical protein [Candidatus Omnitrophota bacterium]
MEYLSSKLIISFVKALHLPMFVGLIGTLKIHKENLKETLGDLGEVTGDNILPKEILISLSSRRGL